MSSPSCSRPCSAARATSSAGEVASQWDWPATSPAELVTLAAEHRQLEQEGDDIDDPLGHPAEAYAACAERLDGLVVPVIAALVKSMPVGAGGPEW